MESNLKVGFARADITPKESVPLAGYGNTETRFSRAVRDNLYLSCYAITDSEDNTLVLINADMIQAVESFADFSKDEISRIYNIPKENIFFCATHSHSAPEVRAVKRECIVKYNETVKSAILYVIKEAMENRRKAKTYFGVSATNGLNFVRHYKATPPDAEPFYFGDNLNGHLVNKKILNNYSSHMREPDQRLYVIKFVREGEKDLLLVNWRAHATLTGGFFKYDVSSDFPGEVRRITEQNLDCTMTYFQGACGNINPKTRIDSEFITNDCTAFSRLLSADIEKTLENLSPVETAPIKILTKSVTVGVNHSYDDKIEQAREVGDYFSETADRDSTNALAMEKGFYSLYHAAAVRRNYAEEKTFILPITVLSVGELKFISAPNEMFDTTVLGVEKRTGEQNLIVLGYTNGSKSYLPSEYAYECGYYEAYNSKFEPGTAEKVEQEFAELINELNK